MVYIPVMILDFILLVIGIVLRKRESSTLTPIKKPLVREDTQTNGFFIPFYSKYPRIAAYRRPATMLSYPYLLITACISSRLYAS